MTQEFVNYNQALALKELGFDEPCFGFYSVLYDLMITQTNGRKSLFESECLAPLKQQVFRWFREKYSLHHVIHQFDFKKNTDEEYLAEVSLKDDGFSYYKTYEEAESFCINKLIEIVKNK
jgi:hypothetical protein